VTTVCRYVGGRSVGANLVKCSVDWPWSSAGQKHVAESLRVALTASPVAHRADWVECGDRPQTAAEEPALARCVRESGPLGSDGWLEELKKGLGWREPKKRRRPAGPRRRKKRFNSEPSR
jgi:hypothetical protein